MGTSRRDFLKTTALAGTVAAAGGMRIWAEPISRTDALFSGNGVADAAGVEFTSGLGDYPGLPAENFNPTLIAAGDEYRNLALLRPAFASSAYDYNLTAQLVTDGIKEHRQPTWLSVSEPGRGTLPREDREKIVDHFRFDTLEIHGASAQIAVELGGEEIPEIDRVVVSMMPPQFVAGSSLKLTVWTSEDGREWVEAGSVSAPEPASTKGFPPDLVKRGTFYAPSIALHQPVRSRFYKLECSSRQPGLAAIGQWISWLLLQVDFYRGQQQVQPGGPYSFTSAWMSAGLEEEWIAVDLGTRCRFDRVKLFWIARAAKGCVEVSEDNQTWKEVAQFHDSTEDTDDLKLASEVEACWVRVRMQQPTSADGFMLSELEVWGRGGLKAQPKPALKAAADGSLNLAGGNWKLQRVAQVAGAGETIAKPGYADGEWLVATVPGTVLTSYYNVGAVPDPNFGANQLEISDSFFYSDFWYRNEFVAPAVQPGRRIWLNFDGINWKADVWLNGEKLGRIEGGFQRGCFDVTEKLLAGKSNALAVCIEKNQTPGSIHQKTLEHVGKNGGALGTDNPTFHASAGWDWIPTMRGRNLGIWGDVTLTQSGAVTLEDPFVRTKLPLPETSSADVLVDVELVNHLQKTVSGVLRGSYGEVHFEQRVTLAAGERKTLKLNPATHPALKLKEPKLWWPAGYGEAHLYDVALSFVDSKGVTLDEKKFQSGVRQMGWSEEGGDLRLWVNGRRFIPRGGNWGFGESMLRYRAREYDAAVRYHREMNFTMIRNWVGQIGDAAFYEACDRHGVMVWQDFWLANPWDGPEPKDDALFLANARDYVKRIRNHASIGLYCGRNEGFPPEALEKGLRAILSELHTDLHYIPSSADAVVSGHGPYDAKEATFYFRSADTKLHSEIGAPAIPPIESVKLMMPEKALWPQGLEWGIHDFCLEGAQGGTGFRNMIEQGFGGANSAEEWVELAQYINYESYRAMFESQSRYRMGVLLWMSHSCWPSFVWQTYDYYFEPTAAYFGCKKGSEPLHIQWNREKETIEVVNYSAGHVAGLTATVEVLQLDGKPISQNSASIDSREDSTVTVCAMRYPRGLTKLHYLRLKLKKGEEIVSENFYLRTLPEGNYRAIRELPRVRPEIRTRVERRGDCWLLTSELENTASTPALMVRIKAVREKSGDRILPAIYSDNYIALMPGEKRVLTTEVCERDTRGERPAIVVA